MKPMLAKKWIDHRQKLVYPLYVQPKINGVRAIYHNGQFQSRDEHLWHPKVLEHLAFSLSNLHPRYILDGELYLHGKSLQQINGAVAVNRLEPKPLTPLIQYWVFDCIDKENPSEGFSARALHLEKLKSDLIPPIVICPTHFVLTDLEADHYYGHYRSNAYEGLMYRTSSPYGFHLNCSNKENRWSCLLKRKDWIDEEFTITGFEFGEGKYSDCVGAFTFLSRNGQLFTAGSGLTDAQRRYYLLNDPTGLTCTIRYEMLSDTGIPLKPTIELVHDLL